jgi:hypothetical protein
MNQSDFTRLVKGDHVRHVASGRVYQVTSVIPPFTPRFRRLKSTGALSGAPRTFLADHVEDPYLNNGTVP